jgi:uracil-DNA glycosylase family 4
MSLLDDFKGLRVMESQCFDNPLLGETFVCRITKPVKKGGPPRTDFNCQGPGVPCYFLPGTSQVVFVMEQPDVEEISRSDGQRRPFTGKAGRLFGQALKEAGLYGEERLGFTTLIKCKLRTRRSFQKVYDECTGVFFNEEMTYLRPLVVICLGENVARQVCPEAFAGLTEGISYSYLHGKTFTSIDRTFYFMADINDYVPDGKSSETKNKTEFKYEFIPQLARVKDFLVSKDQFIKAAGFKPEDLR